MTRFALYVKLSAKPGREEDVAAFLAKARDLVMAEAGTIAWFAVLFRQGDFRNLRCVQRWKRGETRILAARLPQP
jgi:hypothetical protein